MRENKNVKELLKLAAENPSLPIVAMVQYEVVADDSFSYWLGEIDAVDVEELWVSDGRTWTREDAEYECLSIVDDYAPDDVVAQIERLPDEKLREQAAMEWINGLPWMKCIVIFIGTPDDLTNEANGGDAR
ncbi:hypothetical protein [Acidaminococcus fermentans]|uniref:hypothetical protein n=1 Tax=Acidaminococcus fermentans TaxID=905 RepID=UPI003077CB67